MVWIVGIIVVIAFIFLMIAFPKFRNWVLAIAALGGIALWFEISADNRKSELAKTLITKSEIQMEDIILLSLSGSRTITGRIKNNSKKHTLKSLILLVKAFDCPEPEMSKLCETIGEDTVTYYQAIPPGQVRAIDEYVSFYSMPKARNFNWQYTITGINAAVR